MALIKCAQCGGEVSDRAPACPRCGKAVQAQATEGVWAAVASGPPAPAGAVGPVAASVGLGDLGVLTGALTVATDLRKLAVIVVGFFATETAISLLSNLAGLGSMGAASPSNGFRPSNDIGGAVIGFVLSFILGGIVLWVGTSLTIGTVTRMCVEQVADGAPASWRSALNYVMGHLDGFLFGPFVFWVMLCVLVLAEIVLLFLGRIPFIGELLFGVAFLPLLLINLLGVVACIFGWFLIFPAVAADGANAISAGIHVLQFIRRDPIRTVLQLWLASFVAFLVSLVLATVMLVSLVGTAIFAYAGLGQDKFTQIVSSGIPIVGAFTGNTTPPFTIGIARFLVEISAGAFLSGFLALPLVFVIASCCALYLSGARRQHAEEAREIPLAQPVLASDALV